MRTITGSLPITLAEIRDFMRIDDTADDTQLQRCIEAGVDLIERETERDLVEGTVVEIVDLSMIAGNCVTLRRSPAISLTGVTIDGEAADEGTYEFRPNSHRLSRVMFDPIPSGDIEVTYVTGMPDDPTARQACLWAAAHLYSNREPEVVGASINQFETGLRRMYKLLGAKTYA